MKLIFKSQRSKNNNSNNNNNDDDDELYGIIEEISTKKESKNEANT